MKQEMRRLDENDLKLFFPSFFVNKPNQNQISTLLIDICNLRWRNKKLEVAGIRRSPAVGKSEGYKFEDSRQEVGRRSIRFVSDRRSE
jgi:hypothetical protein